jgi:hypothetical protein
LKPIGISVDAEFGGDEDGEGASILDDYRQPSNLRPDVQTDIRDRIETREKKLGRKLTPEEEQEIFDQTISEYRPDELYRQSGDETGAKIAALDGAVDIQKEAEEAKKSAPQLCTDFAKAVGEALGLKNGGLTVTVDPRAPFLGRFLSADKGIIIKNRGDLRTVIHETFHALENMLRIAGDEMNEDIVRYCRDEFNLLIGEKTSEDIKIAIGSAYPLKEKMQMEVRGRDLVSGLPKEIIINDEQVREALSRSIRIIINNIIRCGRNSSAYIRRIIG